MKKRIISIVVLFGLLVSVTPIRTVLALDLNNLKVKTVISGGFFNGVILEDNSLWMWGENSYL